MKRSNFQFLENEFPLLLNLAKGAEANLYNDSPISILKLRLFAEKLTLFIFEKSFLEFPYENTFKNQLRKLHEEGLLPDRIKSLLDQVRIKGNIASHEGIGSLDDAKSALFSAFKIGKWFYDTYSNGEFDISELKFSLPEEKDAFIELAKLEAQYKELEAKFNELNSNREIKINAIEHRKILSVKGEKAARKIELSEAETREIIDDQLRTAGWDADTQTINFKICKTLPEKGKNKAIAEWPCGNLWADYALFIGTKLVGLVEAKKYAYDISTDLSQAKTYSRTIEEKNEAELIGKWDDFNVPFLFSTNGRTYLEQLKTKSGVWFQDVRNTFNRARALHGWISPEGLLGLLNQNIAASTEKLQESDIEYLKSKNGLGLRDYQILAIKAVENQIAQNQETRRALLAMATGTGKTRTILGLCYRLIKANRFKRILFLVDRNLLASQTFDTFKDSKIEDFNSFLDTYKVSKLSETVPDFESRMHFATVQGMVKRLFYPSEDSEVLPVDTYDCIIVDEAHRGYLQDKELDDEELNFKDQSDYVSKYRKVLDYFDAYGIGLTATPALHTTEIFGKAVFTYSYREAVIDGYLIDHDPPFIIKTKLSDEGITWEKGSKPKVFDQENNEIIELDSLDDELSIDVSGFNKSVITESFNRTVIKELVKELDPENDEKTLLFAATDSHADLVVDLLYEEFTSMGVDVPNDAILKITGRVHNPQELVRKYKNEKYPSIVVTVDLLTTGVDVPAICNLVFLRRIKSRILYEQMLGRATRRCDEINKTVFRIYDAVRVYETLEDYTSMKPIAPSPQTTFNQLIEELNHIQSDERLKKQLDQIIAKFQRKKTAIEADPMSFEYKSGGIELADFTNYLKGLNTESVRNELGSLKKLWNYLDELKPEPRMQFFSDHDDEFRGIERGYGKGLKPQDYLDGLKQFIAENRNKISALSIICNKPSSLDRVSLKELKMILDEHGYTANHLNAAWKATKNEDIAADIISFIRTLALGSTLVAHEERIKRAMNEVRKIKAWNKVQEKWLDRFEKQLLKENVLQINDLNTDPFITDGGFDRLNKIFDHQLPQVIEELNVKLYDETA